MHVTKSYIASININLLTNSDNENRLAHTQLPSPLPPSPTSRTKCVPPHHDHMHLQQKNHRHLHHHINISDQTITHQINFKCFLSLLHEIINTHLKFSSLSSIRPGKINIREWVGVVTMSNGPPQATLVASSSDDEAWRRCMRRSFSTIEREI